jgi:hypothetical protein
VPGIVDPRSLPPDPAEEQRRAAQEARLRAELEHTTDRTERRALKRQLRATRRRRAHRQPWWQVH